MASKSREKTIFNKTFYEICKLFDINKLGWSTYYKDKWDYPHISLYISPKEEDFEEFIEDFIKLFKKNIPENVIKAKKEQLNSIIEKIQFARRESDSPILTIEIEGAYEDISKILKLAYQSVKNTKKDIEYPTAHFDNRLLIPSEYFFGRDDLVHALLQKLITKSLFLHGIGGIGKTEIIKMLVKKILEDPVSLDGLAIKDIYWINLLNNADESGEYFKDSIIRATHQNVSINNENRDCLYDESIRIFLRKKGTTLLVIDNAETFTEMLQSFLVRISTTRVILAARFEPDGNIEKNFDITEVNSISLESCKDLFKAYCPFSENDNEYVNKIIELASQHTVSVELLAKLISKQEKSISEFLQILIECGFKFNFNEETEEEVSSAHHLMTKEDKIIEQLSKLFNTVNITAQERTLLIKFSTIPNIQCSTTDVKRWFPLSNTSELFSLSNAGWIKREKIFDNKNAWCIHPIIAAAVRARHSDCLYDICQPFIKKMTNHMKKLYEIGKTTPEKLIQFSWSLTDIFQNRFNSIEDIDFLFLLEQIYENVGFFNRARYINSIALKVNENLIEQFI